MGKYRNVLFVVCLLLFFTFAGVSCTENIDDINEYDIKSKLDVINQYKRKIEHTELTENDAWKMAEFPVDQKGNSRLERIYTFALNALEKDIYYEKSSFPKEMSKQRQLVNLYLQEIGADSIDSPHLEVIKNDNIYRDGESEWDKLVKYAYEWMNADEQNKAYTTIPIDKKEQLELVNAYMEEISQYPIYEEDVERWEKVKGYKKGTTTWDELVIYAYEVVNGNSPKVKRYNEMPKDIDGQLYMVNALLLRAGQWPVMKGEFIYNSNNSQNEQKIYIKDAYEVTNGKKTEYANFMSLLGAGLD